MSTARGAKLKAQYNRVRTSTALRANDMWTNTIGMDANPQAGSNAAIEASIYAPTHGGGNRAQRREMAQQLIQASGYQPSVTDYQGLLTLAKAQGGLGVGNRGACKLCGGLGHTTKQCTNFLTGHNASETDVVAGAAAGGDTRGLLPDPDDINLSDLDTSSDSDSGSESDSGNERRDKKRSSKKRKRSSSKRDKKEKKSKEKRSKKSKKSSKEKSSKRHKQERDSSSDSD